VELNDFLKNSPELDFITFSGAGEPTLNSEIGKLISFLKVNYPQYKIALITNSALFSNKILRDEIADIDLILPSLDAASQNIFNKINRSEASIKIDDIVQGLITFAEEYKGKMWLEVFIVPGINDNEKELRLLKNVLQKIKPDKVQLNTLDRPGTESGIKAASKENLEQIAEIFQPLPTEIIAKFQSRNNIKSFNINTENRILETIRRRPCTDADLTEMLNIHLHELNKYLGELIDKKMIKTEILKRGIFYKINDLKG